jgi:hypothetical protein
MAARCVPSHACGSASPNNSSESFASTEASPIRQVNVSQVQSRSSDIDARRDGFRFGVIHAMPLPRQPARRLSLSKIQSRGASRGSNRALVSDVNDRQEIRSKFSVRG